MSGLFEPLYGKSRESVVKPKVTENAAPVSSQAPDPLLTANKTIDALTRPFVKKNELGALFQELDRSKLFVILLAAALIVVFILLLVINARQKSQRKTISTLQQRLKRLKNR